MADRRPWPTPKISAVAGSIVQTRAKALRTTSSAELRAFLIGIRVAHTAAIDLAEEIYDAADSADGERRTEGFARAAGVKLTAARIGSLFDAAAADEAGKVPGRRSVRALLKQLVANG